MNLLLRCLCVPLLETFDLRLNSNNILYYSDSEEIVYDAIINLSRDSTAICIGGRHH